MDKHVSAEVQADADRLWWSRDPVLDGNRVRIRRFVAKNTAPGPRAKGGMGNMVWADHDTAFLALWVNKYLHPSATAWKQVLDSMLLYASDHAEQHAGRVAVRRKKMHDKVALRRHFDVVDVGGDNWHRLRHQRLQ